MKFSFYKFAITTAFASVTFFACTNHQVELNEPLDSDGDYQEVLKTKHHKQEVIKNFETKAIINVTLVDGDFLSAYKKRMQKVFKSEESTLITDVKNHRAYFVSLYCDEYDQCNLSDKNLWTVQLKSDSGLIKPTVIRKVGNKPRWQSFFPGVTQWTNEYLILFPGGSTGGQSPNLSDSNNELVFANTYANIRFGW